MGVALGLFVVGGEKKDDAAGDEGGEAEDDEGSLCDVANGVKKESDEVDENEQPTEGPGTNHGGGALAVRRGKKQHKTTDDGDV